MNKIRVIIADADKRFVEQISIYLRLHEDIELLAVEENGRDALNRIRSEHPDVVLFDLVLPGLDGLSLLREISVLSDVPSSVCCTRFYSDVSLEAVRTYGASYLLFKPIEPESLYQILVSCAEMHRQLRQMTRRMVEGLSETEAQDAYIRNFIVALGVPSKLVGCSYLTEAVRLARMDMSLLRNLSKGLYLEISRSMSTTPTCIERCIRNAIGAAYRHGELRSRMTSCPTNKEFINYILRNIQGK